MASAASASSTAAMAPSQALPTARRRTTQTSGPSATAKAQSSLEHALPVPVDAAGREVLARFYRALGDPTRLALLAFCATEERTGSQCVAHVGLSQGRVSAHLACLVQCGLLTVRRSGRFAHYRVADPRVGALVDLGTQVVADHAAAIAACARVDAAS